VSSRAVPWGIRKALIGLLIWLTAGLGGLSSVSPLKALEPSGTPARLPAEKLKKRNPAFTISVASLLQKANEHEDILLVDVRSTDEFEKLHIPGSVNIPLFAIKTKAFLKSESLILVDEGYHCSKLERACETLRRLGFKVSYLRGGLYYWSRTGGPLKGDIFSRSGLNKIPAHVFLEEQDYARWVVIDISPADSSGNSPLFPHLVSLPYLNNSKEFVPRLKEILSKYKDNPSLSVLIVDEKGNQYDQIERLLEQTEYSVFFLKGGLAEYRQVLKQQAVIRQAKHHSKKTVKRCANCP